MHLSLPIAWWLFWPPWLMQWILRLISSHLTLKWCSMETLFSHSALFHDNDTYMVPHPTHLILTSLQHSFLLCTSLPMVHHGVKTTSKHPHITSSSSWTLITFLLLDRGTPIGGCWGELRSNVQHTHFSSSITPTLKNVQVKNRYTDFFGGKNSTRQTVDFLMAVFRKTQK